MDYSSLFSSSFRPPKFVELSSDVIVPLFFPGGCTVPAVEGRHLSSESSWKDLRADLFLSAEDALHSLTSISNTITDLMSVSLLVSHSNGKCRRVSIREDTGQEQGVSPGLHTFVPVAVVMGLLLLNLHKFDISKKLRFATLVTQSLEKALDSYPKGSTGSAHTARDTVRLSEGGAGGEEYEESQHVKYVQCYRQMRYLVPPNIARSDHKKMFSDGVPKSIADRVWSKKALWLLCMHQSDIPKVHIADLRGKYDCHGLDIVELRALWHILPRWEGGSPKAEWRRALKARLDELIAKELSGKIAPNELRDAAYTGHEQLMIYDPDRALYRQFGVSVTAVGLAPGQRRQTVYTNVDLRELAVTIPPAVSGGVGLIPSPISLPYSSPDTDSDREAEMELAGNSGATDEYDSSDDSEPDYREADYEGASSATKEGVRDMFQKDSSSSSPMSDPEGEDDGTDKDTELDDLLNMEISFSGIELDLDIPDSSSECSDEIDPASSGNSEEDSFWKDSKGTGTGGQATARPRREKKGEKGKAPVGMAKIPRPRKKSKTLPSVGKIKGGGKSTMALIENYRPFAFAVPLKKPLKRLNFIAAHPKAKTPDEKQGISATDASSLRDFDSAPDFFDDDDDERGMVPLYSAYFPATSKEPGDAPRGATMPNTDSHSSPLEFMYSHQSGDRETFEFNPLVFAPGHLVSTTSFTAREGATLAEDDTLDDVILDTALAMDVIPPPSDMTLSPSQTLLVLPEEGASGPPTPSIRLSRPPSFIFDPPGADSLFASHDYLSPMVPSTPEVMSEPQPWNSLSSKKANCFPRRAKDDSHVKRKTLADDSLLDMSLRSGDSMSRSRSVSVNGSEASNISGVFSTFSVFSMHSVKSAVKYLFFGSKKEEERHADSAAKSGKHVRNCIVAAQLESERAKEKQRVLERRAESPSVAAIRRSSLGSSTVGIAGIGRSMTEDLEGERRVWNIFPAVSARKQRFSSAEEELVDRKIESEIDNFIVPDELSPIILRQYGIEIGMKEVNGIKQNALMSLNALLNRIGSSDEIEEMTESELGLWGDVATPGNSFTGKDEEGPDGIERLISSQVPEVAPRSPRSSVGGRSRAARPVSCNAALIAELRSIVEKEKDRDSVEQALEGEEHDSSSSSFLSRSLFPRDLDLPLESANDSGMPSPSKKGAFFLSGESVSEKSFLNRGTREGAVVEFVPYLQQVSVLSMVQEPVTPLTPEEAEDLILYKEAHLAWSALSAGSLTVGKELATSLLLKFAEDPDSVVEPLETLVLLVDKLGADVNATDGNRMTPLHSLFSKPALGRFILSRGGDVLAKDDQGNSVLSLCAEYGYPWVLPAFMNMHGREAELLSDPGRAHEYVVVLISLWGFGVRARELIEEGLASITADEALEIMDTWRDNFDNMKEPVETFELLEMIVLKG